MLKLVVKSNPLVVECGSLFVRLFMLEHFCFGSLSLTEVDGFIEGHRVDLLQNCLESDE